MRPCAMGIIWAVCLQGLAIAGLPEVQATLSSNHTEYFSEDWEGGIGLWNSTNGVWEVGAPTYGTAECLGTQCAGTNLDGEYPARTFSRLESVPITLPVFGELTDGVLWLGFWHWYSNSASYGTDVSVMQIWTEAAGWEDISINFFRNSTVWAPYYIDITAYSGQDVRLGLLMADQVINITRQGPGWYVDDLRVFDGAFDELEKITTLERTDEYSWDGWFPDRGQWELGTPANGPNDTFSGHLCFGTVLNGDYAPYADSRLISPEFTLPSAPADGFLYLSFMQYVSLSDSYGSDTGLVQIDDGNGWATLQTQTSANNLGSQWTERIIDLSPYAGLQVRLGFVIKDAVINITRQSHGWYIDDIRFSEGAPVMGNPERFENFATSWSSTRGQWEVGAPTSGPGAAYSGDKCWATNLSGNYRAYTADMLMTPPVALPAVSGLYLKFYHWFSFSSSYGVDYGVVRIKPEGGEWTDLSNQFTGTSSAWSQIVLDLSGYAGQTVQFGFLMDDIVVDIWSQSSGWYIDDFEIVGMPQDDPPLEPFIFTVAISSGPAELNFPHVTENIDKVIIYGSPVEDFRPSLGNRLAILPPTTMVWSDTDRPGWPALYYRVSIVDNLGNESVPITAAPISAIPGQDHTHVAGELALKGAAPNPFNPTTYINFSLPKAEMVDVEVYDLGGRKVADVLHKNLEAGPHKVEFSPRGLASGTYFARVRAGGQSQTKKMILLK